MTSLAARPKDDDAACRYERLSCGYSESHDVSQACCLFGFGGSYFTVSILLLFFSVC